MTAFCKSEECPASHELLSFQAGVLGSSGMREIVRHLDECEFCDAEVYFYSHFPQADDPSEPARIPAPLYELAEALLKLRHTDTRTLDRLLTDKEPLIEAPI